jgi:hypothetical protein
MHAAQAVSFKGAVSDNYFARLTRLGAALPGPGSREREREREIGREGVGGVADSNGVWTECFEWAMCDFSRVSPWALVYTQRGVLDRGRRRRRRHDPLCRRPLPLHCDGL